MAAARPEHGSKQDSTTLQSTQRPKLPHQPVPSSPSLSVANRYPTIFLNARKQVARSPVPHVVRRLAPAQPRRHVPAVPTVLTGNSNGGTVLISADNLRRTVYATVPSVSLHGSTGCANGLTNTIVSFAGKQAITIPVQSPNDLVSVVRPTVPTPPATIYKLVNANAGPTGRKRMPQLAPKPAAKNGGQRLSPAQQQQEQKPIVGAPNGITRRSSTVQYNNAPGWRRILRNKVIVYISPSNNVLHNYEQVKEYLLSSGTCKCGLPCPFNPELFFQFDAQIPNMTMAPKNREVLCAHLKRAANGPERSKRLHEETTSSECTHLTTPQSAVLLKTPPWRKNVPMAASSPQPTPVTEIGLNASSVTRLSKQSDVLGTPFARSPSDINANESARESPEQKKPTFKDDPTGYLNQQTAILHSSISFLHSPDRRSPLPLIGGLSPKVSEASSVTKPSPPKEDRSAIIRRQRTVNRTISMSVGSHPTIEPQAKITSLTGVVKYEAKPPNVSMKSSPASASSIKSPGTLNASISPLPMARLATGERGRMAYYVKANNAHTPQGTDQCSSAKVPKLHLSPTGESLPCPITTTTTSTTTTIARVSSITTPTTTGTMFVPTRSSHVINAGGAQIVVIDGLQHSAVGAGTELPGRVRIGGFPPARQQQASSIVPTVTKPAHQPTVVNYNLPRAPNGTVPVTVPVSALSSAPIPTTTTGAMLLNGTNIIHLSNGLPASAFHGGLLAPESSNPTGTNPCLHQVSPTVPTASKTSLTLPNGTLGLASGSTVVLNPTTSIRFADNTSFTTPGGFSTATVASNTYHYSPCTTVQGSDTVSLDVTGARKVKRQLKTLNGTTSGIGSGLMLPASPVATLSQPQPATFQQQLPPGPFVQIASPYGGLQNIQLASTLSGITVVPVSKATPLVQQHQPQQQQHHQQPYGLLGQTQTILLPAGSMVMASDANTATATLLQIQNMTPCGSNAPLLAGQTGLVLRHQKPPSAAGFISTVGQQSYLIGANGTTGTTRTPAVAQRCPLAATSTSAALFGNGGSLGIVTATQSLPVANLTMQQPQQLSLAPSTTTSRTETAPQTPTKLGDGVPSHLSSTMLLHPDVTTGRSNQPECSEENRNETKPSSADDATERTELKPNCVSITETEVPGIAFALKGPLLAEHQRKQHDGATLAESSKHMGRIVTPASGGRVAGNIGFVRRGPSVQAVNKQDRGKLSISIPSTTTEESTCLLTDVRPEQSYDVNAALNQKTSVKSRTKRRLVRGQSDTDDRMPDEPREQHRAGACQFREGDLVWGAVRGFPAWPGKVLPAPSPAIDGDQEALKASPSSEDTGAPTASDSSPDANVPQQDHVWVRWFGTGRAGAERVKVGTLQSLSEGLEIHHRAQKDARKSRKLNAQLEHAIQQAMQELDHAATSPGFSRCGSGLEKQRRRRHQRRQATCKRHRTVGVSGDKSSAIVNSNMCNRKGASVRFLRGNKFKAKS